MLDVFPIYMTSLKQERLIRVYLPKCYSSENKPYPVMYMHDGQNVFTDDVAINGVSLNLES
jgi:predicted alpha/beta superfamily hydrolase